MLLSKMLVQHAAAANARADTGSIRAQQYGSSDSANRNTWSVPVLQGGDGSGG
jgi:hypothetical protein